LPTESAVDTATAYAAWSRAKRSPKLGRRTAELHATALLPHLKPGTSLLDCGCGYGSITLGLARAVAPGKVLGIDQDIAAIDGARELASRGGVANVRFETGDACALAVADASVDAVFAHALLQHLHDPSRAVAEMWRVLRPGGVIALSDADYGGSVIWPDTEALVLAVALMGDLHARDGRSPYVGRALSGLLHHAGFTEIAVKTTLQVDHGDAERTATAEMWACYFETPEVTNHIVALGLATWDQLVEIPKAWRGWAQAPGAIWTRMWFDAVGWRTPGA
jgi:SAM-dependent methyltransferase